MESGSGGWFMDEPVYAFPAGSTMKTRLTAVLTREADTWKIAHMHVSVGVPDEEVAALQSRWATAPTGT